MESKPLKNISSFSKEPEESTRVLYSWGLPARRSGNYYIEVGFNVAKTPDIVKKITGNRDATLFIIKHTGELKIRWYSNGTGKIIEIENGNFWPVFKVK